MPVKTRACLAIKNSSEDPTQIYLIGLSTFVIPRSEARTLFMDTMGRGIYIGSFFLDYEGFNGEVETTDNADYDPLYTKGGRNNSIDEHLSISPPPTAVSPRHRFETAVSKLDHAFEYPVTSIPVKHCVPNDLTMKDFTSLESLNTGSNANLFSAIYKGTPVVIKMIQTQAEKNKFAVEEFEFEFALLSRIDHPNIIKVLGAGSQPRRFIVLEKLSQTLAGVLKEHEMKPGLANRLLHKPSFTYLELLRHSRNIASAINYLHHSLHPEVTVIHRGKNDEQFISPSLYPIISSFYSFRYKAG